MSEGTAPKDAGDSQLEYTNDVRKKIVDGLMSGKQVNEMDGGDVRNVMAALDGIDRQVLAIKKIKSDEGLGNAAVATAAMLTQIFNDPRSKSLGNYAPGATPRQPGVIEIDEEIVSVTILPGELDPIKPGQLNYDSFVKEMRERAKAELGEED